MNELELFEKWFDTQDIFLIKKIDKYDRLHINGTMPFSEVIKFYNVDRYHVLVKEVILKNIQDCKDNPYMNEERMVDKIVKELKELKEDVE